MMTAIFRLAELLSTRLTAAARLHCECQRNGKKPFDEEPRSGGGPIT